MSEFLGSAIFWPLQIAVLFSVFLLRALLIAGGSALWAERSRWAKSRQIIPAILSRRKYALEILQGAKVLLIDALVTILLIRAEVFQFASLAGVWEFAVTFLLLFVWVEIFFYYSHRLFHWPRLFWIHRHHHQASPLNPWTSLSFSLVERLVLLAGVSVLPALVSWWTPFPLEAYAAYFLFNYVLNVYGHLNVETMPPRFTGTWVGHVLNTSTYHALHHSKYRGHYGLFTSTLDRLHGTKFSEYEIKQKECYEKGLVGGVRTGQVKAWEF